MKITGFLRRTFWLRLAFTAVAILIIFKLNPSFAHSTSSSIKPPTYLTPTTTIIGHSDANQAAKFTFTALTDAANNFTDVGSIALNNQGVVAFSTAKEASGITGIYTTDGQAIRTIADIDTLPSLFTDIQPDPGATSITISNFLFDGNNLAINNAGNVLFSVTANIQYQPGTSTYSPNAYKRLFLSQGDTIQSVDSRSDINSDSLAITNTYTAVGVNDSGQIVYSEQNQTRSSRIFTFSQIVLDKRTIDQGSIPPAGAPSQVSFPVINNQGTVFYNKSGYFGDAGSYINNIFRLGSEDSTPVAVSDQIQSVNSLAANDQENIVFSGSLTSRETGLFRIDNGVITKVNDLFGNAKINNLGKIAFQPSQSGAGIFITSGADINKVIAPGDSLLGSTVADIKFGGLNDAGEIAFVASLTDGTKKIFRADPIRKPHSKHDKIEKQA
ncbi:MAG: hypothetical protein PUP91_27650 [Rhizonema sp. PD37]|nr:hypothetical protein [Rhizonema sp. PD37]